MVYMVFMSKWFQVGVFISAALDEQVRSLHPAAESCLHLSDPLAEASSELSADVCICYVCICYVCIYEEHTL